MLLCFELLDLLSNFDAIDPSSGLGDLTLHITLISLGPSLSAN